MANNLRLIILIVRIRSWILDQGDVRMLSDICTPLEGYTAGSNRGYDTL